MYGYAYVILVLIHAGTTELSARRSDRWTDRRHFSFISLSTVVLNSRDRQGMYGMQHFRVPINKPHNSL